MTQIVHTQPKLTCIKKNYKVRRDLDKGENVKCKLIKKIIDLHQIKVQTKYKQNTNSLITFILLIQISCKH